MGSTSHRGLVAAVLAAASALLLAATAAAATLKAEAVLPPGQSGYVSITGVASGTGSPHLTDQTQLFIDFELRPFGFNRPGDTTTPAPGVTITRDEYGIPAITGATDHDAWFGVGYAAAEDRLFELELFRRAGAGRLAEILGSTYLDDDLISRRDYYTDAEVDAMVARIPAELRDRLDAYRDGINAYVDYLGTHPNEIPGEFVALGVPLPEWTVRDSARIGILLARTVPSSDGVELLNAQVLEQAGNKALNFFHPVRTKGRIATIKRREGVFRAQPGRSRADERKGFRKSRRYLKGIDVLGAEGPGTTTVRGDAALVQPEQGERPGEDVRRILPHGGSFMWAIRDERRERAYLFNGPQLGFAIPELFFEFELHSPEQDISGVSAAGVPLVGIGHNGKVAWGFTSGLSDEDDLFAERLSGDESYRYKGQTRQMDCRDEVFDFNTPPTSLPDLIDDPGEPSGSVTERICRTVHGPIQFRGDGVAYARDYAIWDRELETIVGLTELNDADNVKDVDRAMLHVTWNENVMAADSQGRIGYWHPGLHPLRPKTWDERLPYPGTGRAEWRGLLPRRKTPHVVNPERGWLANWNNVPSMGWTNGDGEARERENGSLHRVRLIQSLVREVARHPSYKASRAIEFTTGTTAQQFPFVNEGKLRRAQKSFAKGIGAATLTELRHWDGNYHRTDGEGTVAPGVSIWEEFKTQLEGILLRRFDPAVEPLTGGTGRSHEYDITPGEVLALKHLGPKAYGRAATKAGDALAEEFGSSNPDEWRAPRLLYDVTAQGAGAPPELPFFDRGTWSQSLAMGSR